MPNRFRWSTALKIAAREARASRAKFLFVILAVAVGVGSLTGVRGFSTSFRTMLLRDARTLMAADLSARLFALHRYRNAACSWVNTGRRTQTRIMKAYSSTRLVSCNKQRGPLLKECSSLAIHECYNRLHTRTGWRHTAQKRLRQQ